MIGDAVMASGVLDHLVRARPAARVTVAAAPEAAALYDAMPGLERVIVVRKRQNHSHWLALWADVVRTRWDLAIDLKGSGLPYAVRARRRLVRRPVPGLRLFEQHAALLGLDPAPLPVAWTGERDRARAAALVPVGAPVVALCPTASWAPKMWPAERFAALFGRLAEGPLFGARAAVLGGPGERERAGAAPLLAALPGAIDLVGLLTLPEAAACLARCALAVSNDSGLMHLAAAAGAPTLGLRAHFVAEAGRVVPAGRAADWILRPGDDMGAITVEDAERGCRRVLELARAARQYSEPDSPPSST